MTTAPTWGDEQLLGAYRDMWRIRHVETRSERLFREAKVKGSMHLYEGQEAVAVGVCAALDDGDALSFTYRSHGWALARGIPPVEVFGECFGREVGCARGRGGSKHLGDWDRRILPSNAIVAGGLPVATGVAYAARARRTSDVTIAALGDGALNQGVVHEALTFASLWRLPIVFVCEDNGYAELTPGHEFQPVETLSERAAGYGVAVAECDGMDVQSVAGVAQVAVGRARSGAGPTFLAAKTYRFCGHMTGDAQAYRTRDEVEAWRRRDPLLITAECLQQRGFGTDALDEVRDSVAEEVATAEAEAWSAPEPEPADIYQGAPSWTVQR